MARCGLEREFLSFRTYHRASDQVLAIPTAVLRFQNPAPGHSLSLCMLTCNLCHRNLWLSLLRTSSP